jgi:two-component system sensor histidine kinase/response regulator
MTAHAMPEDRTRCFAVGMDDYLTKPVAIDDLRVVLTRWRGHGTPRGSAEPGVAEDTVTPEMPDVFDRQQALTHAGGDPGLLLDLIRIFQGENDKLLAEIRSGLLAGDPAAVERGAHRMKGSLGTLAAWTAREAASRLETLGRAGELTDAASALGALEQALSTLDAHLAAISTSES